MFTVNQNSKTPRYCQLADWLEELIAAGEFRENGRLPAERELCGQAGVSRDTVRRAYLELERRNCIFTERGSGSYVRKSDFRKVRKRAGDIAREAVRKLKEAGFTRHETERVILETMWDRLPESEKLKVAWIDCSTEILNSMAAELERDCNVRVTPFLLEAVEEDPGMLPGRNYDLIATTINHIDDLERAFVEKLGRLPECPMEKMVLTISRMTVSRLAGIAENLEVAVIYESEWYRSNMERFLEEFAVNGKRRLIRLAEAMDVLKRVKRKTVVILPQDLDFGGGAVGELHRYCAERGMPCIVFEQAPDNGSLLNFRKQLQKIWIAKAGSGEGTETDLIG